MQERLEDCRRDPPSELERLERGPLALVLGSGHRPSSTAGRRTSEANTKSRCEGRTSLWLGACGDGLAGGSWGRGGGEGWMGIGVLFGFATLNFLQFNVK